MPIYYGQAKGIKHDTVQMEWDKRLERDHEKKGHRPKINTSHDFLWRNVEAYAYQPENEWTFELPYVFRSHDIAGWKKRINVLNRNYFADKLIFYYDGQTVTITSRDKKRIFEMVRR